MIQKNRKNRKQNDSSDKIFTFLGLITVAFLAGFLIFSNFNIYKRRSELNAQIYGLRQELSNMEKQKEELEGSVNNLSNSDYLEGLARERLNLRKPGEEVVVVIPPESNRVEEAKKEEKGFWGKIIDGLGF